MRIAVIGGGINGVMSAWAMAKAGHEVDLFERGRLMGETSSASTKLLHGGLRYLEHGAFGLVREALHERAWWIDQAPHLAGRLQLVLPIWNWTRRSRWMFKTGLWLYDRLAGRANLGTHAWMDRDRLLSLAPHSQPKGLLGGFTFWDGRMDDRGLGLWAADQAKLAGLTIHEDRPVQRLDLQGGVWITGQRHAYDRVLNVAGPWAKDLLDRSGIPARFDLDLVRGSHLIVHRTVRIGILSEVPDDHRIAFLLPGPEGTSLLGTTEIRQRLDEPIACSMDERTYLIRFHDRICAMPLDGATITRSFSGLRPLVCSAADPSRASREYAFDRQGAVLTVFGGKWTTSRILGQQATQRIG